MDHDRSGLLKSTFCKTNNKQARRTNDSGHVERQSAVYRSVNTRAGHGMVVTTRKVLFTVMQIGLHAFAQKSATAESCIHVFNMEIRRRRKKLNSVLLLSFHPRQLPFWSYLFKVVLLFGEIYIWTRFYTLATFLKLDWYTPTTSGLINFSGMFDLVL